MAAADRQLEDRGARAGGNVRGAWDKGVAWPARLREVGSDPATAWDKAVALANTRLNFVRTNALDEIVARAIGETISAVWQPSRCGLRSWVPRRLRI